MEFITATTTLRSIAVIEPYLLHLEHLGATGALVIDLGSDDGTLDVLQSRRWEGFVHLLPSSGMAADDSPVRLLAAAKERFSGYWCLFGDPDEFVSPAIGRLTPEPDVSCYQLPRRNVTAPREALDASGAVEWSDLRLEIVRPIDRTSAGPDDTLTPPWIHTRVFDKIFVRIADVVAIGEGDHTAVTKTGRTVAIDHIPIRHYPMRSYSEFERKVRTIETYYALNPQLPPGWAWHWRRWVRLMKADRLAEEFFAQFPDAAETARFIAEGVMREIEPLSVEPSLVVG